ncbi:MAG: hypothetical protein N2663_03915 [Chlorobi bacterium]|nr:hypothetical protein [Chlorobiota bacterium]
MDSLHEHSDAEMPSNGHHDSDEQQSYRPPRRRIIRSVFRVQPEEPYPAADDQRRFFPPEPTEQRRQPPWDYHQSSEWQPSRSRYSGERTPRRWGGRSTDRDRPRRSRFRRRIPFIEPADRNRLTPRPTTIVRALVRLLYCSRKLAKQAIKEHVVTVNDRIVREPIYTVRLLYDTVRVDGLLLHHTPRNIYIIINKPRHYAGSREPNSRHVFNFLMKKRGWYIPLGPLSKSVGGLVIVTNDAEQRVPGKSLFDLMEKEYHIKVHKNPAKRTLTKIAEELQERDPANQESVRVELLRKTKRYAWLSVVATKVTPHDLYRIFKEAGLEVIAMDRYRIGTITHDGIAPGSWRRLSQVELTKIFPESVPAATIEQLATDEPWHALYQRWFKST